MSHCVVLLLEFGISVTDVSRLEMVYGKCEEDMMEGYRRFRSRCAVFRGDVA